MPRLKCTRVSSSSQRTPPYFDNISYAVLSDYFYIWQKKCLRAVYPELYGFISTPKGDELIAMPYRQGGSKSAAEEYFVTGMRSAMEKISGSCIEDSIVTIYYAFKQSEIKKEGTSSTGWATFLQAVFEAGLSVLGTWPVRTERSARLVAVGTNALANSVVLVCRKKEPTAEIITRAEFIRALKRELPPAIAQLRLPTSRRPTCRNQPSAPAWACSHAIRLCSRPTIAR